MISDHLLNFAPTVTCGLVQPHGEQLVELGSLRLREPLVGGVSNEHVAEPEGITLGDPGAIGSDQLLTNQPDEIAGDLGATFCRREGNNRGLVEDAAATAKK